MVCQLAVLQEFIPILIATHVFLSNSCKVRTEETLRTIKKASSLFRWSGTGTGSCYVADITQPNDEKLLPPFFSYTPLPNTLFTVHTLGVLLTLFSSNQKKTQTHLTKIEKYTDSTTREYLQIYIKFEQHHFCSTHIHQFDNSSIALHCNFFIRHTFQHTQSKQSHKSGRCAIHLKINIRSTCTKPMKQ